MTSDHLHARKYTFKLLELELNTIAKNWTYFGLLGVLFLAELFDDTRSFGSEFSLSLIGDFMGDVTF